MSLGFEPDTRRSPDMTARFVRRADPLGRARRRVPALARGDPERISGCRSIMAITPSVPSHVRARARSSPNRLGQLDGAASSCRSASSSLPANASSRAFSASDGCHSGRRFASLERHDCAAQDLLRLCTSTGPPGGVCGERRRFGGLVRVPDRFQCVASLEQTRTVSFGMQARSSVCERDQRSLAGAGGKRERLAVEA